MPPSDQNLAVDTQAVYNEEIHKALQPLESRRWRLDNLYRIVDESGMEIDFHMNYAQKLLYLGMWYWNIILKSRQHGITTFMCLYELDACMFNSNTHAALIAHTKADAEEFFYNKIRFAYDHLPDFLRSGNPAVTESARHLRFSNGSSLRVTTSGRSGTHQIVHISEFGKMCAKYPEKAKEVVTGTLNTVHPGRIVTIESTAEGREGKFYEYATTAQEKAQEKAKLTRMDWKFFFFGWQENSLNRLPPDEAEYVHEYGYQKQYLDELEDKLELRLSKGQRAWYCIKWNQMGDDMKREHPSTPEEAFEASIEGAYFWAEFYRIRTDGRICEVPYDPAIPVDTWWDIGVRDSTSIWFTQNIGRKIHVIRYFEYAGEGLRFYVDKLGKFGYRYGRHVFPHDIRKREFGSGKTIQKTARLMGLKTEYSPRMRKQDQIEQARQKLEICWFDRENCTQEYAKQEVGLASLEQYRKEWDERLGTYKKKPLHNWASNGADAFMTLATAHTWSMAWEDTKQKVDAIEKSRKKADAKGWT